MCNSQQGPSTQSKAWSQEKYILALEVNKSETSSPNLATGYNRFTQCKPWPISIYLRAFLTDSSNFCTVWRMNSNFYLYLPTFLNTHFNRFSILFSILFKYYFFHSLFILFLTTTHLPTFFLYNTLLL